MQATGLSPRRLRNLIVREVWRRPGEAPRCSRAMPPELLVRMRALVEGTMMTQRAIARELRVSPGHVSLCIQRHGWVRPRPEPATGSPVAVRWGRRAGRPYRADVVAAVRDLYVGTVLPLGAIAARTGISFSTVGRLGHRHGWVRPEGAPLCNRHLGPGRVGPRRRVEAGRERVRALAERWAASWAEEPAAAGALAQAQSLAARAAAPPP